MICGLEVTSTSDIWASDAGVLWIVFRRYFNIRAEDRARGPTHQAATLKGGGALRLCDDDYYAYNKSYPPEGFSCHLCQYAAITFRFLWCAAAQKPIVAEHIRMFA